MLDAAKIIADFTPGAAGVWTLVAMLSIYLIREWRETRKLSAEDRLARRDGYAAQVASLMTENRLLRADIAALEKRHDEYRKTCQEETRALQMQIIDLEHDVKRLQAQVADDEIQITRLQRASHEQDRRIC